MGKRGQRGVLGQRAVQFETRCLHQSQGDIAVTIVLAISRAGLLIPGPRPKLAQGSRRLTAMRMGTAAVLLFVVQVPPTSAEEWSRFRGPGGSGPAGFEPAQRTRRGSASCPLKSPLAPKVLLD